ncbi:helix-turn-helix transcriptional regulator [Scytonema sp. UIC 10036]|uniref:helix-turn-helix transcriptional regulator n=1 Tax=Scytonema sp. UIC 10036 TaxID=2304196 RepID=UPI00325C2813
MIIKSEQQYNTTKEWLQKFEKSVTEIDSNESLKADPVKWQLYHDAYQSQVDEFKQEIAEYERLINCDKSKSIQIKVESLNKLPDALVKARIAASLSHQQLAELLGIEVQRVKDYEDSDYQCASFVEILEVSTVLGVEFENATVRVDFEEIEHVKKVIEKWDKNKASATSKI